MRLVVLGFFLLTSCASPHAEDGDIIWHDNLPTAPKLSSDASFTATNAHIIYLIHAGKTQEAITQLLEAKACEPYLFHEGALETLGLALLEQGASGRFCHCLF
jgi:hypothetical protein